MSADTITFGVGVLARPGGERLTPAHFPIGARLPAWIGDAEHDGPGWIEGVTITPDGRRADLRVAWPQVPEPRIGQR